MAHTTMLYIACGAGLFYLTLNPAKVHARRSLIISWFWYLMVLFSEVLATLFRAAFWNSSDLALATIWLNGLSWLLLSICVWSLTSAVLPEGGISRLINTVLYPPTNHADSSAAEGVHKASEPADTDAADATQEKGEG